MTSPPADPTPRQSTRYTPLTTRVAAMLCLLPALGVSVLAGLYGGDLFTQPDASHYLHLAAGQPAMLPFASRQLAPLLVRALHFCLHLSLENAFVLEGLLALALFQGYIGFILFRSRVPLWMIPATLGLFFWARQFNGLVFPDLVYAAILCGFLLLTGRQRLTSAALLFFPLMLARESTVLTLACFLVAGRRQLSRRQVVLAIASAAAGLLAVKLLTANALPNSEHIAPWLYLLAKAPWNLLKNVFGISLWADAYPACTLPQWRIHLPFGPVPAIGFCGFDFSFPLRAISAAVASFGLLPLLLFKLRRDGSSRLSASPAADRLLLRFCVLYGGVSFLLTPLLGELFARLYDFGWPLFLVALPLVLGASRATFRSAWAAAVFLILHLLLSWSPLWLGPALVLEAAIVLLAAGWLLIHKTWQPQACVEPQRPAENERFAVL